MARKEIVVYTDDVTGEESTDIQTVLLVADGIAYEVDMSPATYQEYSEAIEPYRSAGKRIGRTAGTNVIRPAFHATTPTRPDKEQNKAVREWWTKNQGRAGLPAAGRTGRIPQPVLDAFQTYGGRPVPEPEPVPPAQTRRKAGTVGSEVKVNNPEFAEPGEAPKPRKRAAPAATSKPRKRSAS